MLRSMQAPTRSLDVRGPFGQDELYEMRWVVPSPVIHDVRCADLSFRAVVHSFPTIVPVSGSAVRQRRGVARGGSAARSAPGLRPTSRVWVWATQRETVL